MKSEEIKDATSQRRRWWNLSPIISLSSCLKLTKEEEGAFSKAERLVLFTGSNGAFFRFSSIQTFDRSIQTSGLSSLVEVEALYRLL